jgi:hypothetical protein
MSSHYGLEFVSSTPKNIVVFSTSQNLTEWVKDGARRRRSSHKEVLQLLHYDQEKLTQFIKNETDKEKVEYTDVDQEIDSLRQKYIRNRAYQMENYIQ